ncbi:jg27374, partial [Pararge aegeria aegeria]
AGELLLVQREALAVLQLGQAAAERQHAAAEVAVRRELAAEVLRRPAVEEVAASRALRAEGAVRFGYSLQSNKIITTDRIFGVEIELCSLRTL